MGGFFRMEVKVVRRTGARANGNKGTNSAIAGAAYISATKISVAEDAAAYISGEQIGTADYTHKQGVIDSWVVLSENAPEEFKNPAVLWKSVDDYETYVNADLYREWICSFDKHLSIEEMHRVAQEFAESLIAEGMAAVHIAIHDEKDENGNYHMHVLAPTRGLNPDGTWEERKVLPRHYMRDDDGNKLPVIDKKTGKQRVTASGEPVWRRERARCVHDFNDFRLDNVGRWRRKFAEIENKYLPLEHRVSAESYRARGIDKIPGQHIGKAGWNLYKRYEAEVDSMSEEKKAYVRTKSKHIRLENDIAYLINYCKQKEFDDNHRMELAYYGKMIDMLDRMSLITILHGPTRVVENLVNTSMYEIKKDELTTIHSTIKREEKNHGKTI